MRNKIQILGIDAGSVSIGLVVIDGERKVIAEEYRFHRGEVRETLAKMILQHVNLTGITAIAATDSTPAFFNATQRYNNDVATIAAAKQDYPQLSGLLHVGGEKFSLAAFDEYGHYLGSRTSTSCAAGTGSFLDQQAGRLGLKHTAQLSEMAENSSGQCPKIASRCAVFAKTDLIHAQQEGYQLDEISEGLCRGLAKNIVDTLFTIALRPGEVIFSGGVSRNRSVVRHIETLTGQQLRVAVRGHLFGAYGAALSLLDDLSEDGQEMVQFQNPRTIEELFQDNQESVQDVYEPLELHLSKYPDFNGIEHYLAGEDETNPIEVDIYQNLRKDRAWDVILGIDVGSTSTKAVLLNTDDDVVAGFYTRTAGQPLLAVQSICRAISDIEQRNERRFTIRACGTTGSGRKFIGRIVGADLIVDEITSHARAAYQLNPEVDTIIEIGGQDAKFTTLVDGRVTGSTMNTVCAAGTGSFIEEQATKLGCPINQLSEKTLGVCAPLASDRCTVFMERDINHLLSEGYRVTEVLAAALHSVRENYLRKVASLANIGKTIFFQGATAKNQALVAAFEQRLNKPILVSKFCHLTGALGTALLLGDEAADSASSFIGIDLHTKDIPVRSEICDVCTNHCKLTVTNIDGVHVAYGFLCGRDYETKRFIKRRTDAFDLAAERSRCFRFKTLDHATEQEITIGLPAAVHLVEDLPLWERFYSNLRIPTINSSSYADGLSQGKKLTGAEFCAPMTAMHGHVAWLQERSDYVFLPIYLEEKRLERRVRRQYCYYTQYLAPLVSTADQFDHQRLLQPVVRYLYTSFYTKIQLYRMLQPLTRRRISFLEISQAYDKALEDTAECRQRWRQKYQQYQLQADSDRLSVVLLGRPYNIHSPQLNGNIPRLFNELGIDTFSQEMVEYESDQIQRIKPLLSEFHWHFAAKILEVAEVVAQQPGVYPVYLTSFKCSPDSFALDYFKRIMAHYQKPYLICELDEHDSHVGYETRIEAASRSFRNHLDADQKGRSHPQTAFTPLRNNQGLVGKTIVMPNWDRITCSFLVSTLKGEGIRAVLMEESEQTIRRSLKHNSGQCIPLNAVAQGFMETVDKHRLDPAHTLLWMNRSHLACNIRLYPYHIQTILSDHGLPEAAIYYGQLTFADIGLRAMRSSYFSYFLGGMLRKVACRIRPYEVKQGETDRILEEAIAMVGRAFEMRTDLLSVLDEVITRFEHIEQRREKRTKVAIFGDLYSRDNRVMNQDLIRFVEAHGGEVITTPYSEYAKMIAKPYFRKWFNEGLYFNVLSNSAALATMKKLEKSYLGCFNRILKEPEWIFEDSPEEILSRFDVSIEHTGESMDNLLKVHYIKKHYPDVALFIQASPALCCASLITEAMRERIEQVTGVPVVSVTYDGTGGLKNEIIIPYLRYPRRSSAQEIMQQRAELG